MRGGPLTGKNVVLVCSPQKASALSEGLAGLGAKVEVLQTIAIREIEDHAALDAALLSLDSYAWVIFTSSYAVDFFCRRMLHLGLTPGTSKVRDIAAVGPATAATLQRQGFRVSLLPEAFVAEGVLAALARRYDGLNRLAGLRILLPRAREARDVIPRELSSAGALVEVTPCYETVPGTIDERTKIALAERPPDLVVFTSSSTVDNFFTLLQPEYARRILKHATAAALGPITAKTLEGHGKLAEILPPENTGRALLGAIAEYYLRGPLETAS